MVDQHCRIGAIRYKDSNLVEIIPRPRGYDLQKGLRRSVERIIETSAGDMAGAVCVAWDFPGRWIRATHMHTESPIGQTFMPSFVSEILRRDTMRDVIDETIFWQE